MMPSAIERVARRRGRCLLLAAAAVGATGLCAAPAPAAATPMLTIGMTHLNPYGVQAPQCEPTKHAEPQAQPPCGVDPFTEKEAGDKGETFARESAGNAYTIKVENTGTEATSGPLTVADQLPEGMVLDPSTGGNQGNEGVEAPGWACTQESGAGGVHVGAVKCSPSSALLPHEPPKPITLHVLVEPQAKNPSSNVAKVSGGGALPAETGPQEGETTVTPAVPFGITSFGASVFKQPEAPLREGALSEATFSQAGGHPFAITTELVLNSTTSSEGRQGNLVAAGGGPKKLDVELPPGFSGNPQNAPQCPIEMLFGNQCPRNTAVGFAQVTSKAGSIFKGRVQPFTAPGQAKKAFVTSLVYNMQPTPGSPAEFGFDIGSGVPFLLEAKLRSDRDYGVTVGDEAVGEKPLASRVTICANGAQEVNELIPPEKEEHYACNPAPESSQPFLRNPTECSSSPPVWTLATSPWDEPENHANETAVTPALEGCESLPFHPEIEFKPSPASEGGTSQADEPTGMTLDLKNPQTNEAGVDGCITSGPCATPDLKNVVMKLPPGLTVSPSAADGLQACSNAQFGLGTEFGPGSAQTEPAQPASCPLASQIGTVEVFSPLLSGAPTVEGIPGKSEELTCSPGTWSASPALSYQWLRGGVAIEKEATGKEYAPKPEDEGKALQCQVTATNAAGSSVAVSRNAVGLKEKGPKTFVEPFPAPPRPPASVAAPSGTASAGNALTCAEGRWTQAVKVNPNPAVPPGKTKREVNEKEEKEPEEAVTFAYQWLRGGEPIAGANASSYTLTSADEGKVIQCQVTGTGASSELSAIADSAAVVASPQPSLPPLPGAALQGQLFVAEPECSPCTNEDAEDGKQLRLFLQAQDPTAGVVVKLHGITQANTETGQLTTTFEQQPQQPFELLELKLKGGPRATLANPQSCGPATTSAELTPWSSPFPTPLTSTYNVDFDGAGGGCPGVLPFSPSFNAGTTGPTATTAGAYTNFSLTFSRRDREQNLAGLTVTMPRGLVGKIAGIPQCGEAQANAGTCGPESQIGTTTAGAGSGPDPLFLGGKVYLTGPYKGAPFGLSIVVPAVAGPFNLGNEVVRSAIYIDPNTAAVTVVSDPLRQIRDGVPFRLREVNVQVNRPEFMLNPTNCSPQQVSATVSSAQGATAPVSSPFGVGGCGSLPFHPELTAEAGGNATKANGTDFIVKVKSTLGQANIAKTDLTLPIALPSRLTTIQKACVDTVFDANPAACDEGSNIGIGIAHTPLLKNPLVGPAYLVSHGGAAFPDVEFVLQGEGVLLVLDGKTDIKGGITYSRFETVPDAPVSTFETVLPAGPHSALTANVPEKEHFSLCNTTLLMPTEITGQNGAVIKQTTHIAVTGCARKPSVKIGKIRHTRNGLLVTATTNAAGTVWVSGAGLKKTHKKLSAGTHQIRVAFTKWGSFMHQHHKKTSVRVKLIDGRQAVTKSNEVRL